MNVEILFNLYEYENVTDDQHETEEEKTAVKLLLDVANGCNRSWSAAAPPTLRYEVRISIGLRLSLTRIPFLIKVPATVFSPQYYLVWGDDFNWFYPPILHL